jgi:hypothetical protein
MRLLPLAAALAAVALPVAAQSHPSLGGTWVLDLARSSADGPVPLPMAETSAIAQHGDTIDVDQKGTNETGDVAIKRTFAVDGKAWPNLMNYQGTDMQLSSVLAWKEAVLSIETTTDYQGTPVQQSETWTPSADGKTLTVMVTTNIDGAYFASMTKVYSKK